MESQVFEPRAYSLNPVDLIPDDDFEDADVQWLEYCRCAATLNRVDLLQTVLSDLDCENSPLYDLIDSALQEPHEPGRPKESITVLAGIGKQILQLVAQAVDNAVGLRQACQEVRS
jgi:hypothetical protein